MVDRGADIGFASQFPHEEEILFAPLTGVEVYGTAINVDVLIVQAKFTVNMLSLTLEQVLSRRRKVVSDMTDAMKVGYERRPEFGVALQSLGAGDGAFKAGVQRFLSTFDALAKHDPTYYNDDEQLGGAVIDAVALSKILEAWPKGLEALAQWEKKKRVADLATGEDGVLRIAQDGAVPDDAVHGVIALSCGSAGPRAWT